MPAVKHELKFLELVRLKYYAVFENGDIYRTFCRFCKRECFNKMSNSVSGSGYRIIDFHYNRKPYKALAHRIVYSYFKGEIPDGMQINHIDGDKGNNALSNLEVVTPSENMRHAVYIIKTNKYLGVTHHNARLKPPEVARIIYFYHRKTYTARQLSARFGVSVRHITRICKIQAWRCLFDKDYVLPG